LTCGNRIRGNEGLNIADPGHQACAPVQYRGTSDKGHLTILSIAQDHTDRPPAESLLVCSIQQNAAIIGPRFSAQLILNGIPVIDFGKPISGEVSIVPAILKGQAAIIIMAGKWNGPGIAGGFPILVKLEYQESYQTKKQDKYRQTATSGAYFANGLITLCHEKST